jgi:hypothetical protein
VLLEGKSAVTYSAGGSIGAPEHAKGSIGVTARRPAPVMYVERKRDLFA